MSGPPDPGELRPAAPARRPESARSRDGAGDGSSGPSEDELKAIERHLASLPVHGGGHVLQDTALGVLLVRAESPGQGLDYAAAVRWPEAEWQARLAAVERRARDDGTWPSLLLADGLTRPADLPGRLAHAGWTELGRETALWARRPVVVPHLDPQLRLEAGTARSASEYEELERAIFGLPAWGVAARVRGLTAGFSDGSLRAFLVRSAGVAAAVARLSVLDGSAGLYGIGVAPERRREDRRWCGFPWRTAIRPPGASTSGSVSRPPSGGVDGWRPVPDQPPGMPSAASRADSSCKRSRC